MRAVLFAFVLAISYCTTLTGQANPIRIALTTNSTVKSADMVKGLGSNCPDVSLTVDPAKADYTLEAVEDNHFKFTVFNKDGDAVYSTTTHRLGSAVKDVCRFIKGQKK